MNAKVCDFVAIHFSDQAFDKDLRRTRIELINHSLKLTILGVWCSDDERVGGSIRLNLYIAGGGYARLTNRRNTLRQYRAQSRSDFCGFAIFKLDDIDARCHCIGSSTALKFSIQLLNQVSQLYQLQWVARTQDNRIAARVSQDHRRVGATSTATFAEFGNKRCQLIRIGIAQRHDF